jgi:hypothetical protein
MDVTGLRTDVKKEKRVRELVWARKREKGWGA